MHGYLSDQVQVTLIYLRFQSLANRSLRFPTVSLKRPTKTKQAPNADGFPSWEESVGLVRLSSGDTIPNSEKLSMVSLRQVSFGKEEET